MDSPGGSGGDGGDAKSITSKTSISVTLPPSGKDETKRSTSPIAAPEEHSERHLDVEPEEHSERHLDVEPNYYSRPESENEGRYDHTRPLTTTPVNSKEFIASGSNSPSKLLNQTHTERELIRQAACSIIERAWISYRDKQMFRLLKHAVCAAENSLSTEILRKVCPKEAELLMDKSMQVRVRFRFGGTEFPPMIFFKIFIHTSGRGVKYMSGKKIIKPASEASEDSLRLMGNRQFYDQMLRDAIFQQQYRITDEVDVTTLKDYMQYLANLDESPACQGGKENYWRKLTLDALSRRTIFYDIVDYLYNQRISSRLQEEIPVLMQRPLSQEIKVQHIRAISELRLESVLPVVPMPTPKSKMSGFVSGTSSRRSRQAKLRAKKFRKMYGLEKGTSRMDSREPTALSEEPNDYFDKYGIGEDGEELDDGEEWEREASKLYEWTQELSFNDDLLAGTPRMPTGVML